MDLTNRNFLYALFFSILGIVVCFGQDECPYGRPNVKYEKEVFVFIKKSDNNKAMWSKLAWNKITTLALFMDPDPELICLAHKNNVKAVFGVFFGSKDISTETGRASIAAKAVKTALKYNLDGVNIDFEGGVAKTSPTRAYLLLMVQEMKAQFDLHIKNSQISVDVPYSPDGTSGRWYDYLGISYAADFLLAMDYDLENFHVATANSGYPSILGGTKRYLDIGVSPSKLVLAMPWYGYKFNCRNLSRSHRCVVKNGLEVSYTTILQNYFKNHATTPRMWDSKSLSPFFDIDVNGALGQVWYDDPESLGYKYMIAAKLDLLGVGVFTANQVDYTNTTEGTKEREGMWNAIPFNRTTTM